MWNSSLLSLALLTESMIRNFQCDFQKHMFAYFTLEKRKGWEGRNSHPWGCMQTKLNLRTVLLHPSQLRFWSNPKVGCGGAHVLSSLELIYFSPKAETSTFTLVLVETWVFLPSFCLKDDKCGNETQVQHSAPPESPVLVSLGFRGSRRLLGSSQDKAHQEYSVWVNMQILGSANTNTVNYTQQKHTQQPGSHMIDIMLWLCCGTFIFIGKHFRQQFRFT